MAEVKYFIGDTFSRLRIIGIRRRSRKKTIVTCLCVCGNVKNYYLCNVTMGKTTSCGCFQKERCLEANYTHKMAHTRQYKIWAGIKNRCLNVKHSTYNSYGGAGIGVCERWNKFENFWEDMKDGYSDGLSIDRIDNNSGYSKENCRWATKREQMTNRKNSLYIEYNGKYRPLIELAEEYGIRYRTLYRRIYEDKWDLKKSLKK